MSSNEPERNKIQNIHV